MIKKYLAFIRAGLIEAIQFRVSAFVIFVGNIVYLIILYFLWKAIYASSATDVVNGMTFCDTLIYLVLATALFNFMEMYAVWEIGRNIQSGKIVLDLLKPLEYRRYLFMTFSGSLISQFLLTFLTTFIIVVLVTDGRIHIGLNLLLFVISVIMAISVNYSIDFIVGTICLYTESIWGINIMKQVIVMLLSGATIPIAFFPETFKKIIYFLPFQSIYNAPLTILLNYDLNAAFLLKILGVQLIWCAVMMILSKLFWNYSVRRITVNGG